MQQPFHDTTILGPNCCQKLLMKAQEYFPTSLNDIILVRHSGKQFTPGFPSLI